MDKKTAMRDLHICTCEMVSISARINNIYRLCLRVVLYGYETSSLTLRVEYRLKVFENRVLRKICRPKRDEVTEECRRLHNEELYDLNSSPNIIQVTKSEG